MTDKIEYFVNNAQNSALAFNWTTPGLTVVKAAEASPSRGTVRTVAAMRYKRDTPGPTCTITSDECGRPVLVLGLTHMIALAASGGVSLDDLRRILPGREADYAEDDLHRQLAGLQVVQDAMRTGIARPLPRGHVLYSRPLSMM